MSALPPKADIGRRELDVCFVPKADIASSAARVVRRQIFGLYSIFITLMEFPSGIPMRLSAHPPQHQLAALRGAIMKVPVKIARLQSKQGESPFSAVACLALLLLAGILVKFAAWSPMFHVAHWN
jgi:hypothetical protein